MSDQPTVSIVTATRNRIGPLRQALQSIAAQDFQDYEAIIVDDGSDPDVQEEYEGLLSELPPRFKLHHATSAGSLGRGPSAARNIGMRRATGTYLAFLDDDDAWIRTDHLSVAVEAIKRCDADFFFANLLAVRGQEVVSSDWFSQVPELTSGRLVHDAGTVHALSNATVRRLAKRQGGHPDGWVVRRSLVSDIGGFWEKSGHSEDYQLFTRILDIAKVVLYRRTPTVAYRLPAPDSVSAKFTRLEEDLQIVANALHLRANCKNRWAFDCARAQESWHLRRLAIGMLERRRFYAARSFAFDAVCVYPTLGGMALLARTALESLVHQDA